MRTTSMGKTRATTLTRIAQVGFVLVLAAGAAIGAMGLPKPPRPVIGDVAPPATADQPGGGAKSAAKESSATASAARFAHLSNAPKKAEVAAAPTDTKPAETTPAQPQSAEDMKYLGIADVGPMRFALLTKGGRQRFLREGQQLDSETLTAIDPTHIMLRGNAGAERRLDLSTKSADVITKVARTAPGAGNARPGIAAAMPTPPPQSPNAALAAQRAAEAKLAADRMRAANGAPPGDPYSDRMEEFKAKLRESGQFKDEDSLVEKAKAMVEDEMMAKQGQKQ